MAANATLGQMVIQIAMDLSAYQKAADDLKNDAQKTGAAVGKAGSDGAKGMDALGSHTASARREMAVMLHELATGNIQNFEGSLLVLGERLDILSKVFSPAGLGITAVAAVIGAFGVAAYKGAEEADALNAALKNTGNYAGLTAGQVSEMAASIGAVQGGTTEAQSVLTGLANTGKFTGDALGAVGKSVLAMAEATGQSADKVVAQYAKMSDGVATWAAEQNEQYHYLTLAEYDHIKDLEEAGAKSRAEATAADLLTKALENQHTELGWLPAAWKAVGDAAQSAWRSMMNYGKPTSAEDRLADLKKQLVDAQASLANGGTEVTDNGAVVHRTQASLQARITDLQNQIANQQAFVDNEQKFSAQQSQNDQIHQAAIDADNALSRSLSSLDKNYARAEEMRKLYSQFVALKKEYENTGAMPDKYQGVSFNVHTGDFSGGLYDKAVADINNRYKDHDAAAADKATLQQQVDAVRQSLSQINNDYRNSETVLEAAHNSGTLSDAAYYQQQRDLIAQTANDQTAQLQRELTVLQAHKASGAEQIQINKQIQDVEQQLQEVRDDTATKFKKNVADETTAQAKRKAALDEYTSSLNQQIATQQNSIDLQVASVGMGSQEAQQMQQLNALQRSYDSQRTRLASEAARVPVGSDQYNVYQQELAALQDANTRAVAITQDGFTRMKAAQGDWRNGATQAFQNYADSANNIASQVSSSFTDMFRGMEDAAVQFATTGKLSFDSLTQTVLADLARMAVRAAETPIFGALGSFLGLDDGPSAGASSYSFSMPSSFSGSGALFGQYAGITYRAGGGLITGPGTPTSDSIHVMASDGEFMVNAAAVARPGVLPLLEAINSGRSVAGSNRFANGGLIGGTSGGAGAGGGLEINVSTSVAAPQASSSPASTDVSARQLATQLDARIKQQLVKEMRQGGVIWSYMNGR